MATAETANYSMRYHTRPISVFDSRSIRSAARDRQGSIQPLSPRFQRAPGRFGLEEGLSQG